MNKPLLFLDYDGVLNVFSSLTKKGFTAPKTRSGETAYTWETYLLGPVFTGEQYRVVMAREYEVKLAQLGEKFTLVWATTWQEDANKFVSPKLNLPNLPVVRFPRDGSEMNWKREQHHRGSWKTMFLARWVENYAYYLDENRVSRPLPWVFVDDEVNRYDTAWLRDRWANDDERTYCVYRVEPTLGLRDKDFDNLLQWEKNLRH